LFLGLFVLFAIWEPDTFLTTQTWRLLLDNQAITALASVGLVLPLSAGVIDLAIGSEVGMGAIVVAWLLAHAHFPIAAAVALTLLVGAAIGVVISGCIVRARISSFIATLAVSSVLLATIDWISGSQDILDLGKPFQTLATGQLLGVTYPVYIVAAVALAVWWLLDRSALGRRIHATGGNPEAARLAGVRTSRMILIATVGCGMIAGLAGLLASSQLATGDPTISTSYLIPSFAATFLGSTQLRAGRFNVPGTLIAVATLAVGVQGFELAGAPVWLPNLFDGIALLVAVGLAERQSSPSSPTAALRRLLRPLRAR
jgi:ribose transport system permease protein